jgi:tRNA(His) 5'-end guanylyltransferase
MIKHIVFWNLKDYAAGASKAENALKIKAQLEGLNGKIKEIKFLEVGINNNDNPAAYDIALYSEFATKEDLDIYQRHPEHLKAGELVGKVRTDRRVVDYEV